MPSLNWRSPMCKSRWEEMQQYRIVTDRGKQWAQAGISNAQMFGQRFPRGKDG